MQPAPCTRSLRLLPTSRASLLRLLRASSSPAATKVGLGDAAVHSEDPQGEDAEEAAKVAAAAAAEGKQSTGGKGDDGELPLNLRDNVPPFAPPHKLESHEVSPPWPPFFQQKRRLSSSLVDPAVIVDVACVGPDGSPLVRGANVERQEEKGKVDDYKEYYEQHKPSPLSEIKFADTRKPITRATDGGYASGDTSRGFMMEETVDDALARAEAIFKMRAMMGDPDLPHSVVLRKILREMRANAWYS